MTAAAKALFLTGVLITEGLAGVRGKYGSKIEIRYNGPDLCV